MLSRRVSAHTGSSSAFRYSFRFFFRDVSELQLKGLGLLTLSKALLLFTHIGGRTVPLVRHWASSDTLDTNEAPPMLTGEGLGTKRKKKWAIYWIRDDHCDAGREKTLNFGSRPEQANVGTKKHVVAISICPSNADDRWNMGGKGAPPYHGTYFDAEFSISFFSKFKMYICTTTLNFW